MIELLKALRKARRGFPPVVKDQENPFFHSKYAALDSIIRAVTPALDDNDLTLLAGFEAIGRQSAVWMELHHDSGESLPRSVLLIPVKRTTKTDKKTGEVTVTEDNPQDVGSGISYMVRYSIKTYLGLPLEDDDGNRASGNRPEEQRRQPQQQTKPGAQGKEKANTGKDTKKSANEPPSGDVIKLKQQAAMMQNQVLRDNLMAKLDLDAMKMRLFDGSLNLPDDAGKLAEYIAELGKVIPEGE